MIDRRLAVFERLAALALPSSERDQIQADLQEEALSTDEPRSRGWVALQMLRIAARYHFECYREPEDQWRIIAVLASSVVLLWIVPAATARLFPGDDVFSNPVMLAIVDMFRASHVTSAVAAGLLVGRVAVLPEHASVTRWHVVTLLVPLSLMAHGLATGSVATVVLVGAAWLGDRSRRAVVSGETTHTTS